MVAVSSSPADSRYAMPETFEDALLIIFDAYAAIDPASVADPVMRQRVIVAQEMRSLLYEIAAATGAEREWLISSFRLAGEQFMQLCATVPQPPAMQ
jgi:hypothetical protein